MADTKKPAEIDPGTTVVAPRTNEAGEDPGDRTVVLPGKRRPSPVPPPSDPGETIAVRRPSGPSAAEEGDRTLVAPAGRPDAKPAPSDPGATIVAARSPAPVARPPAAPEDPGATIVARRPMADDADRTIVGGARSQTAPHSGDRTIVAPRIVPAAAGDSGATILFERPGVRSENRADSGDRRPPPRTLSTARVSFAKELPFAAAALAVVAVVCVLAWLGWSSMRSPSAKPESGPVVTEGSKADPQAAPQRLAATLAEGDALFAQGFVVDPDGASAVARYREALSLDPSNGTAREGLARASAYYIGRGDGLRDRGDLWAALESYRKAVRASADAVADARVRELEAALRASVGETSSRAVVYKDAQGRLLVFDDLTNVPAADRDRALVIEP